MKKFEMPNLEIVALETDIIATSSEELRLLQDDMTEVG